MPKKTKKEIEERRDKVKTLVLEGLYSKEISRTLQVPVRTIERDRQKLREEIVGELAKKPLDKVLFEFLMRYDGIYRDARKTYRDTSNDNVKIGALNLMQKHEEAKIKILQSLGVLEKAAEKVHLSGDVHLSVKNALEKIKENRIKKQAQKKT